MNEVEKDKIRAEQENPNQYEAILWIHNENNPYIGDDISLAITKIVQGEIREDDFELVKEAVIEAEWISKVPKEKIIKLLATEDGEPEGMDWLKYYTIEITKEST